MRILLDTNVFLWTLLGSSRAESARELVLDSTTDVFISAASWWEIAIKIGIGKLNLDFARARAQSERSGFFDLAVTASHAEAVTKLPVLHRDPFDRMLVAQAVSEPMKLLTGDKQLAEYSELVYLI